MDKHANCTASAERRSEEPVRERLPADYDARLATIAGSFLAPAVGWRTVFLLSAAPALVLLAWKWLPETLCF